VPTVQETLIDQLVADFVRACTELEHARLLMSSKDSTGHRRAVAEWAETIDLLLDMSLAADCPSRTAPVMA
jgi:hypothetical protein